MTAANDQNYLT